jgi:hypothetical protein
MLRSDYCIDYAAHNIQGGGDAHKLKTPGLTL